MEGLATTPVVNKSNNTAIIIAVSSIVVIGFVSVLLYNKYGKKKSAKQIFVKPPAHKTGGQTSSSTPTPTKPNNSAQVLDTISSLTNVGLNAYNQYQTNKPKDKKLTIDDI